MWAFKIIKLTYRAEWNMWKRYEGMWIWAGGWFDFGVGDGLLQLLEFGPAEVSLEPKADCLASGTQYLDSLVVVETLQSLRVHLNNAVVDLDLSAHVGGTALAHTFDENSGQLLCTTIKIKIQQFDKVGIGYLFHKRSQRW